MVALELWSLTRLRLVVDGGGVSEERHGERCGIWRRNSVSGVVLLEIVLVAMGIPLGRRMSTLNGEAKSGSSPLTGVVGLSRFESR